MTKEKIILLIFFNVLGMIVLGSCTVRKQTIEEVERDNLKVEFPLENPVKLSIFGITNEGVPLNGSKAFQIIEEKCNIEFEVQSIERTYIDEKRELLLLSNQYPDLFVKSRISRETVEKYAKKGVFIPLDGLIEDYAPNLNRIFQEKPEIPETLMSDDGHIYSLGSFSSKNSSPVLTPFWINQAWLENLNREQPMNIDELYEVLIEFKRMDANNNGDPNDEIPFSVAANDNVFKGLLPYFGRNIDGATNCTLIDGHLEYALTSKEYKEVIRFLTKLRSAGALDTSSFTQSVAQLNAVGTSGDLIGATFAGRPLTVVSQENAMNYTIVPGFYKDAFYKKIGSNYGSFVMTNNCEHPEIAIAWIDQFYSDEGRLLATLGIEGESFMYLDDSKTKYTWLTPKGMDLTEFKAQYVFTGGAYSPTMSLPNLVNISPIDRYVQGEKRNFAKRYCSLTFPVLFYTEEEIQYISSIKETIDSYMNDYEVKVITGELDLDRSWEDHKAKLNEMGLEKLMAIYNRAYKEAIGQ